jgi:Tfp pilus assembly protein FimT
MKFSLPIGRSRQGISLIEMLVYMSVLVVILGVGYSALYRCLDHSNALRRSADDIANALHAGEDWRADIRVAGGRIQLETLPDGQIIRLPGIRGDVSYRFADHTIFRRLGNNEWSPLLANVKTSNFIRDQRPRVTAWRWELELQPRARKLTSVKPLFTFLAVPVGDLPK